MYGRSERGWEEHRSEKSVEYVLFKFFVRELNSCSCLSCMSTNFPALPVCHVFTVNLNSTTEDEPNMKKLDIRYRREYRHNICYKAQNKVS